MAKMSSRCRGVVASSRCPAKKEMRCAPLSAPSKPQQSTTLTAEVKALQRPPPRRSSRAVQDPRRWRRVRSLVRISARYRAASLQRIGKRARRPPRAGLGGSLLEGLRPCQHHEGGARAPLGGVLHGTFPSGGHRARSAHRSGVHHQDHSGTARCKGHARRPPLTRRSSPSRRGCRVARLH